ncbi:hypothetical protein FOG18_12125 [Legionella israelensis]|uniref:hypothetical protein n=1 Tax=Legionella israelensis TaxID=454 RepID=UPI00117F0F3D|nr:hypothetical protein [Legionella israelensis]QDP73254.1 hypothetical protein FOG18_12125 [Legionella israelensis]
MSQEEALEHLNRVADHGMVYNDGPKGPSVYHSFFGSKTQGVGRHPLSLFGKVELGTHCILRFKDEKIASVIGAAVDSFNRELSREQLNQRPKNEDGVIQLTTPFANFHERQQDDPERVALHELFRAFRAHMRSTDGQPLSKNKGVSCSNLVSYAVKIAIIERLFPQEVPLSLQLFYTIEYPLKQVDSNIKKLSEIELSFFEAFDAKFREELKDCKEISDIEKEELYKFLCLPVKGHSIGEFCSHLKEFPNLFAKEGYLVMQEGVNHDGEKTLTPGILNPEELQAVSEYYKGIDKKPIEEVAVKVLAELGLTEEPISASRSLDSHL